MTAPGSRAALSDWLRWQSSLSPAEIELGLDRVIAVLETLDLPRPPRVYTVGGTNGKGSTVTALQTLLTHRGDRVGAYTSPHLLRYAERVRIDSVPVSDATLVAAFATVEAARRDVPLTYFEFGTLAALVIFADVGVDTAVLEVGLGGRLDAVNAVDHDGCVITNVSLDHMDWLGDSVEAIAAEKAGILRAGRPAVFSALACPAAIQDKADELGTALLRRGRDFDWQRADDEGSFWSWHGTRFQLTDLPAPGLSGRHQVDNVAGALALLEAVDADSLLDVEVLSSVLPSLHFAGRLQRVSVRERDWVLDGAHNAASADSLAAALRDIRHAGQSVACVLGVLADKDAAAIVRALAPVVDGFVTLTPDSPRAIDAAELAALIERETGQTAIIAPDDAFEAALKMTANGDLIVVAGSFYTLSPALGWLEIDVD